MKRSAAPSLSRPDVSKRMKAGSSQPSQNKSSRSTPVTAKQQKAFHFLISAAAYNSISEGGTTNHEGLRDLCSKLYHGYDEDHIGMVGNFLEGNGRFNVLWDDGKISSGFGPLTGLSHESLSDLIRRPTLIGTTLITGRQILEKAKACLLESKKFLAYWKEFLVNDQFPSGTNEDNALRYVFKRAQEETSTEVVGVDDEGMCHML